LSGNFLFQAKELIFEAALPHSLEKQGLETYQEANRDSPLHRPKITPVFILLNHKQNMYVEAIDELPLRGCG